MLDRGDGGGAKERRRGRGIEYRERKKTYVYIYLLAYYIWTSNSGGGSKYILYDPALYTRTHVMLRGAESTAEKKRLHETKPV